MNFRSQRRNRVFSSSSEEESTEVFPFISKGLKESSGLTLVGYSIPPLLVLSKQNSVESSKHSLANDLESLADNRAVFIQRVTQQTEASSIIPSPHFQVTTTGRYCLYEILESQGQRTKRLLKMKTCVNLTLVDCGGAGICDLIWDGDTSVTLQRNATILGKVTVSQNLSWMMCAKKLSSPTYTVWKGKDEEQAPIQRIILNRRETQNRLVKNIFSVFPVEGGGKSRLLGSISCCARRQFGSTGGGGGGGDNKPLYALNFHDPQIQRVEKALWIAAVVLMDFQE